MREARKSPASPNTSAVPRRMRSPKRAPALPRDDERAAAHAVHAAGQACWRRSRRRCRRWSACRRPSRRRPAAPRVAVHDELAGAHAAAGVVADIAVDAACRPPSICQPTRSKRARSPSKTSASSSRGLDAEEFGQRHAARCHGRPASARPRRSIRSASAAGVTPRRSTRSAGACLARKRPAAHAARSPSSLCRWKWNGPSLPP